ncbi:hypothetical protein M4D76_16470 [Peribacillus frigoritolerans]|uniref:hypothetical protein n=1 Tax=Peribacillus TaxID=2675229 RepID=UPI0021A4BBBF|nr:hypothetical protein [Peribacillus frigoritolerans]MCT1389892.1 hypothetical protein [Peribacillus frigoritolerans]
MLGHLFALLDSLAERQQKLNNVVEILGGEENHGFLSEQIKMVELMIVKAFGGNEGHYEHISSTPYFYNYEYYKHHEGNKAELIGYIEETIENDWTEK